MSNSQHVLEMEEGGIAKPQTTLFLSPNNDSGDTQFLLATYPPTVLPKERGAVEMQYVIDISGSMTGTSIEQARRALLQALDRLRPHDRFGILAFNDSYQEFTSATLPATPDNLTAAREYVQSL